MTVYQYVLVPCETEEIIAYEFEIMDDALQVGDKLDVVPLQTHQTL